MGASNSSQVLEEDTPSDESDSSGYDSAEGTIEVDDLDNIIESMLQKAKVAQSLTKIIEELHGKQSTEKMNDMDYHYIKKAYESAAYRQLIHRLTISFKKNLNKLKDEKQRRRYIESIEQALHKCDVTQLSHCSEDIQELIVSLNNERRSDICVQLNGVFWSVVAETTKDKHEESLLFSLLKQCIIEDKIDPLHKLHDFNFSRIDWASAFRRLLNINHPELERLLIKMDSIQLTHHALFHTLCKTLCAPLSIEEQNTINGMKIVVTGGRILLSDVDKVVKKHDIESIGEVHIRAAVVICVNCDIVWENVSVSISAPRITVNDSYTMDLSGSSSTLSEKNAKSGTSSGENGTDGKDGAAGKSSGNVLLMTDVIDSADMWSIRLNGGCGADGQNGGDGKDGANGSGITISQLKSRYGSGISQWGMCPKQVFDKLIDEAQTVNVQWKNGIKCYCDVKLRDGCRVIHAWSQWIIHQTFTVVEGSEGQRGGDGGRNGLGGEGGYAGEITVIDMKGRRLMDMNEEAYNGVDGKDGEPGKNGRFGRNGGDVGYYDYEMLWELETFGGGSSGVEIEYWNRNASDRVYNAYKKEKENSEYYYAKLKTVEKSQPRLTEATRSRRTESARDRRQQASRCVAIDKKEVMNDYQSMMKEVQAAEQMIESERNFSCQEKEEALRRSATSQRQNGERNEESIQSMTRCQVYDKNNRMKKTKIEELEYSEDKETLSKEWMNARKEVMKKLCVQDYVPITIDDLTPFLVKSSSHSDVLSHLIKNVTNQNWIMPNFKSSLNLEQLMEKLVNEIMSHSEDKGNAPLLKQSKRFIDEYMKIESTRNEKCAGTTSIFDTKKHVEDIRLSIEMISKKKDAWPFSSTIRELVAMKIARCMEVYFEENGVYSLIEVHNIENKNVLRLQLNLDGSANELSIDEPFLNMEKKRLQYSRKCVRLIMEEITDIAFEGISEDWLIESITESLPPHARLSSTASLSKITSDIIGSSILLKAINYAVNNGRIFTSDQLEVLIDVVVENFILAGTSLDYFAVLILMEPYKETLFTKLISIIASNMLRAADQPKFDVVTIRTSLMILRILLRNQSISFNGEYLQKVMKALPNVSEQTLNGLNEIEIGEWMNFLKKSNWKAILERNANLKNLSNHVIYFIMKIESSYNEDLMTSFIQVLTEWSNGNNDTDILLLLFRIYTTEVTLSSKTVFAIGQYAQVSKYGKSVEKSRLETILGMGRDHRKVKDILRIEDGKETSQIRKLKVDVMCTLQTWDEQSYTKMVSLCSDVTMDGLHIIAQTNDSSSLINLVNGIKQAYTGTCRIMILLEVFNQVLFIKKGFYLRDTQKCAILLSVLSERSVLSQVSTGEGKTIIIMAIAVIRFLLGERVEVVTSSAVLAKRDATSQDNRDIYSIFGIEIGHVVSESMEDRRKVYKDAHIVYGDLGSFQRDYLMDRFYGHNILGGRTFTNVIVDEVDSMLLDNGNNILYLSHEIAGMDRLQSLFVYIWKLINTPVQSSDSTYKHHSTQNIRACIIQDLYGMIRTDLWNEEVIAKLRRIGVIGNDGRILQTKPKLKKKDFDEDLQNEILFEIESQRKRERVVQCPETFYPFIDRNLDSFIENAKTAFGMEEGVDYVIDVDRSGATTDVYPRVIIVDRGTGTDQSSSQWNGGLHQFIQLKHGCKLSLLSLKAVFISNVSFLKMYNNIYGFSGTLGSTEERNLLTELYNCDLVVIPTSQPKRFVEYEPLLCSTEADWIDKIVDETCARLDQRRTVLIIAESVRDVKILHKGLLSSSSNRRHIPSFQNMVVYKREHEEFEVGQGNEILESGRIIISTNLAGRGTDLKLSRELAENGGLHVIMTFMPDNQRVEEQAFGRAARCGDPGSGQIILLADSKSSIFDIKLDRDSEESLRLQTITTHYMNRIIVEEACFRWFRDVYGQMEKQLKISKEDERTVRIKLNALLDEWSLWLDEHNSTINDDHLSKEKKMEQLSKAFNRFKKDIKSDYIISRHPFQALQVAIFRLKKNEDNAISYLNMILAGSCRYLDAEVMYYKAAVYIRSNRSKMNKDSSAEFRQLKTMLCKARNAFDRRVSSHMHDDAFISTLKRSKKMKSIVSVEGFESQQKAICQIYNMFIRSIDDIIGCTITESSITSFQLTEPIARYVLDILEEEKILTPEDSIDKEYCEAAILDSMQDEYGLPHLKKELMSASSIPDTSYLPNKLKFWDELENQGVITKRVSYYVLNKQALKDVEDAIVYENDGKPFTDLFSSAALKECPQCSDRDIYLGCDSLEEIFKDEKYLLFRNEYFNKDSRRIKYLMRTKVIRKIEKATIDEKKLGEISFHLEHSYITLQSFIEYGIPKKVANQFLEELVSMKFLKRKQSAGVPDKFQLIDNEELVIPMDHVHHVYRPTIEGIINSAFCYEFAFHSLRQTFYERISLRSDQTNTSPLPTYNIRLMTDTSQSLIMDLRNANAIPGQRVLFNKLANESKLKTIIAKIKQSVQIKNYDKVFDDTNIAQLLRSLKECCSGLLSLDTPDVNLQNLSDLIKDDNSITNIELDWFNMNGCDVLISLCEQKYSFKFWIRVAIITVMAIAQIVAASLIEIFSAGLGTYAASFLMSEGVGDLMFVAESLWTGECTWNAYAQHKKVSVVISATTLGVAAIIAKGRSISRIGYKIAGKMTSGSQQIAKMTGKKLIEEVGKKAVIRETMKRIAFKTAEGLAYGAAQGGVNQLVHTQMTSFTAAIESNLNSKIDNEFNEHELRSVVEEVYKRFGEKKARLLLSEATRESFTPSALEQSIFRYVGELNSFVQRSTGEYMRKISTVKSTNKASTILKTFQGLSIATTLIHGLKALNDQSNTSKAFLDRHVSIIKKKTEGTASVTAECTIDYTDEINQQMDRWLIQVRENAQYQIAVHVIQPIISTISTRLVAAAGRVMKKGYRAYKESKLRDEFNEIKKEFDAEDNERKSDEQRKTLKAERDTRYNRLMAKTKSPSLLADIVKEGVMMETVCLEATTTLMNKIGYEKKAAGDPAFADFDGVKIEVKSDEGYAMSAGDGSKVIQLVLMDNHYMVVTTEGQIVLPSNDPNSCLFDAVSHSMPSITDSMGGAPGFREQVAATIRNDPEMKWIVQQGWHTFALKKGFYGGRVDRSERVQEWIEKNSQHVDDAGRLASSVINKVASDYLTKEEKKNLEKELSRGLRQLKETNGTTTQELEREITERIEELKRVIHDKTSGIGTKEVRQRLASIVDSIRSKNDVVASKHYSTVLNEIDKSTHEHPSRETTMEGLATKARSTPEPSPDVLASIASKVINDGVSKANAPSNTVAVATYKKLVFVAFNFVENEKEGKIGVSEIQCEQIRAKFRELNLLTGKTQISFVGVKRSELSVDAQRAPHAEMALLRFLSNMTGKENKINIGASKPVCLCCAVKLREANVNFNVHKDANRNPKNWNDPNKIKVKPIVNRNL